MLPSSKTGWSPGRPRAAPVTTTAGAEARTGTDGWADTDEPVPRPAE